MPLPTAQKKKGRSGNETKHALERLSQLDALADFAPQTELDSKVSATAARVENIFCESRSHFNPKFCDLV